MECFEETLSEPLVCQSSCHGLYADIVNTSFPTVNDQELHIIIPLLSFSTFSFS